jgi:hypothetical protein
VLDRLGNPPASSTLNNYLEVILALFSVYSSLSELVLYDLLTVSSSVSTGHLRPELSSTTSTVKTLGSRFFSSPFFSLFF